MKVQYGKIITWCQWEFKPKLRDNFYLEGWEIHITIDEYNKTYETVLGLFHEFVEIYILLRINTLVNLWDKLWHFVWYNRFKPS